MALAFELGELDRTATFSRPRYAVNGRNERTVAGYDPVATVRAKRRPVSDAERNAGAEVRREVTDRFVTHWSAQLAALELTGILRCEGLTYDLVGRKELGRRQGLEWSAQARPEVAP